MEIERKYLIHKLPDHLEAYPHRTLEQAYLCTEPVVRVRRDADDYILTYKSKGLMMREEYNLPLTKEAYCHLLEKADGRIITKERYCIPYRDHLTIELDVFAGDLAPLLLAKSNFLPKKRQISLPRRTGLVRMSPFPANIITVH